MAYTPHVYHDTFAEVLGSGVVVTPPTKSTNSTSSLRFWQGKGTESKRGEDWSSLPRDVLKHLDVRMHTIYGDWAGFLIYKTFAKNKAPPGSEICRGHLWNLLVQTRMSEIPGNKLKIILAKSRTKHIKFHIWSVASSSQMLHAIQCPNIATKIASKSLTLAERSCREQ